LFMYSGAHCMFSFTSTDTTTTANYPLPLHDALPICAKPPAPACSTARRLWKKQAETTTRLSRFCASRAQSPFPSVQTAKQPKVRSEEHTSELQSRFDLVCRLLLEKKKENKWQYHNRS